MSQAKTVRIWSILKKLIGAHQGAAPGTKFVQCRDYLVDRAITQLIGRYIYMFISFLYHTVSCIFPVFAVIREHQCIHVDRSCRSVVKSGAACQLYVLFSDSMVT